MSDPSIEITISPLSKLKAQALILKLLSDHGFDENENVDIDFIPCESNLRQIGKCLIKFENLAGR